MNKMKRVWFAVPQVIAMVGALGACGSSPEVTGGEAAPTPQATVSLPPLPDLLDRVREAKGLLVAAHRGGSAAGYPENAIETLQYGFDQGIRVFEVDVAESQDGVLYLMHDRSLRRTGGHDGGVADTDWDVVSGLDLRDLDGNPTGFAPPRLVDALRWARQHGAILELDRKDTTSFRNIVREVRAEGAENHVLMISYSDDETIAIAQLAPELMMTGGVKDKAHQDKLRAAGVDLTRVVAWLGTRDPNAQAMEDLAAVGIESAFGTLGRPGRRLDDTYAADGDASEYQALVDGGLTLLATDRPYFVARELTADDVAVRIMAE